MRDMACQFLLGKVLRDMHATAGSGNSYRVSIPLR